MIYNVLGKTELINIATFMKSPAYNTKYGKTHVECEYRIEKISKLSKDAIELLKSIEELKLFPYDDQTGKTINSYISGTTMGYGHLIKKEEWERYKDGISEEEANILFNDDLLLYETSVYNLITAQLSQN